MADNENTITTADADLETEYREAEASRAVALQHLGEARARREHAAQAWMSAADAAHAEKSDENIQRRDELRVELDDADKAKANAETVNGAARARLELAKSMTEVVAAGGADAASLMRARRDLGDAEAQDASAQSMAAQATAKLEAAEAKRRGLVVDATLGDPAASKALKAANATRDDAAQALEDLQLATNATAERVAAKRAALNDQITQGILGQVVGLGIKRIGMLRDLHRKIDEMLELFGEYNAIGAQVAGLVYRSRQPLAAVDQLRSHVLHDRQNFALMLAQMMPLELFREMPDQRYRERDFVAIEADLYEQLRRAMDEARPTKRNAA